MKSPRLVFVLMFLALAFLMACGEKPGTPATTTNNANPGGSGAGASEDKGKKPAAAEVTVIPSGTVIVVRLGETLSSKNSQSGQGFSATVAQPVEVGGKTVI